MARVITERVGALDPGPSSSLVGKFSEVAKRFHWGLPKNEKEENP
jgi:hypothetical protein